MSEALRKRVGLCVCGGIAAYKAVEVMRLLQRAGCDVRVAMTKHATEFVQPLTFKALTGEYVLVDDYDAENPDPIAHINFSQNIDLLLIVPATANMIGKIANGVADDFVSSTYLACNAPVLIAPAMNTSMWDHPATQRNIEKLKSDGVRFVEPAEGELACKTIGTGKLEDVETIVAEALTVLGDDSFSTRRRDLEGERLLITVGGTREAIDPVRFISNASSGKMGFAIAKAAFERGAEVVLVAGVTSAAEPKGVEVVRTPSANEMHDAVMKHLTAATLFIGAAAVADYRPRKTAEMKIKKDAGDSLVLEFERTPDILSDVSAHRTPGAIVVGFAAETENVIENARQKLAKKNLDLVVANDITQPGAGFDSDTNIVTFVTKDGTVDLPLMPKTAVADRLLDEIVKMRREM